MIAFHAIWGPCLYIFSWYQWSQSEDGLLRLHVGGSVDIFGTPVVPDWHRGRSHGLKISGFRCIYRDEHVKNHQENLGLSLSKNKKATDARVIFQIVSSTSCQLLRL